VQHVEVRGRILRDRLVHILALVFLPLSLARRRGRLRKRHAFGTAH
jgi:hypothetical protein